MGHAKTHLHIKRGRMYTITLNILVFPLVSAILSNISVNSTAVRRQAQGASNALHGMFVLHAKRRGGCKACDRVTESTLMLLRFRDNFLV